MPTTILESDSLEDIAHRCRVSLALTRQIHKKYEQEIHDWHPPLLFPFEPSVSVERVEKLMAEIRRLYSS